MKYYQLKYFEDEDQENPSIQDFRAGYDVDAENSATNIFHYQKINLTPDLDFVLDSNGKATDLLKVCYVMSDYLCVTPKLYDVLKKFRILRHQCFDAIVRDKENKLPYYFLHFYDRFDSDENSLVDFEATKFYAEKTPYPISFMAIPTDEEGVLGEFKVNSWHEYHGLREKVENDSSHKVILPLDKLYIKQKEFIELDLFFVDFNNFSVQNFIVSEKLAKEITNNISGVQVKPLPYEIEFSQ